jgi:hypothetical protein
MRILFTLIFLAIAGFGAEPEAMPLPRHILTNDGLVVLARAGVGDGLLVDLIKHKRTMFDTSADALALLARHGLSEKVLRAVVEKQEEVQLRRPRLTVSPVGQAAGELEEGEAILVQPPGPRRLFRSEPERWYKITMR